MTTPEIGPSGYPTWDKDPQAVKDYSIDWSAWLDGDTITTSTWTVPTGLTLNSETETTTVTKIWLSGGTVGKKYKVSNKIVTTGGRTDVRSFEIVVKNL